MSLWHHLGKKTEIILKWFGSGPRLPQQQQLAAAAGCWLLAAGCWLLRRPGRVPLLVCSSQHDGRCRVALRCMPHTVTHGRRPSSHHTDRLPYSTRAGHSRYIRTPWDRQSRIRPPALFSGCCRCLCRCRLCWCCSCWCRLCWCCRCGCRCRCGRRRGGRLGGWGWCGRFTCAGEHGRRLRGKLSFQSSNSASPPFQSFPLQANCEKEGSCGSSETLFFEQSSEAVDVLYAGRQII